MINSEWFAILIVNDRGQDVRLGGERLQNVARGVWILKFEWRGAVRSENVRQRVQILDAQFLEAVHPIFREGDPGGAQSGERRDHDHNRDLAPQRKFVGPAHFSCSRSVPLP